MKKSIPHYSMTWNNALVAGDKAKMLELLHSENMDVKTTNEVGDTVLHLALKNMNCTPDKVIEILDFFINLDVDPNVKNTRGHTVLHLAVIKRKKSIIEFLLNHNANINVIDNEGNTIAHTFVENELEEFTKVTKFFIDDSEHHIRRHIFENESVNFVEWLMSKRFNFDVQNQKSKSALHLALEYNLQHILPPLLKITKDITYVSEYGIKKLIYSFLTCCSEKDLKNIPKLLGLINESELSERFVLNSQYRIPSDKFSKQYEFDNVKVFLERDDFIEKYGLTAMCMAVYTEKYLEIADMLYDRFAKVSNKQGGKLVRFVVEKAISEPKDQYYLKMLQALFAKGVKLNIEDESEMSPLCYAVKKINLPFVKLMKENGVDLTVVSRSGQNALFWLLDESPDSRVNIHDQNMLCDLLISEGCNVRAVDSVGQTPLHLVSKTGKVYMAIKLLVHGADVNCHENLEKKTPLHLAAYEGHLRVARLLLDRGADINSVDSFGNRPLHLAVKGGHLQVATFLLDRSVDVNCKGSGGDRPLHFAAAVSSYDESMMQMLLERGALVNARNDLGDSALVKLIQMECTHKESWLENIEDIINHLVAHGADIKNDLNLRGIPPDWLVCHNTLFLCLWIKFRTMTTINSGASESEYYRVLCSSNKQCYRNSLKEIEMMKNTGIDNNHTTLHDWLHFNAKWQYIYSRNKKLRSLVNSPMLKRLYPLYYRVICGYYCKAIARKKLIQPAKEAWIKLTKANYLPDICTEYILAHLNDGDLINLIELDGCDVVNVL